MTWTAAESSAWAPTENLLPSEWAERYRELSASTSAEPGRFRWSRVPFLRAIADAVRQPGVEEIVICKPAQIGGTTLFETLIGYWADQDPGPCMLFLADQATAEKISKDRLQPMFRSTPRLASMIVESQFNIGDVRLANGFGLEIGWSSSIAKTASRSIRNLLLDEIDKPGYSVVGEEGGTLLRLEQRTETFGNRMILKGSTPTTEHGNIMRELATCDVVYDWRVPCPRCGAEQPLRFSPTDVHGLGLSGGVIWEGGREATRAQIDRACYQCCACSALWSNVEKNEAVGRGRMVARSEVQRPRKVGYHINRLVSLFPGGALSSLVRGWIAATASGDPLELQGFLNSVLAEPWVPRVKATSEDAILKARCDLDPMAVHPESVALIAGVDMQMSGFWLRIRAFAPDKTSWGVFEQFVPDWDELDRWLFEQDYGGMRIWRVMIDTGGSRGEGAFVSRTEEAYGWVARNHRRCFGRVFACKGSSRAMATALHIGQPIERTPTGKPIPGGIQVVSINTDALKEEFFGRLQRAADGEERGGAWLHRETGEQYARQITAEELRTTKRGQEWVRLRPDNHYLDCEVLCLAGASRELWGGVVGLRHPSAKQQSEQPRQQQQPARPRENPHLRGTIGQFYSGGGR